MRRQCLLFALCILLVTSCASRPPLYVGLGEFNRQVGTNSPEAQRYFDQGFVLCWGFNHDEAVKAFEEATRLDPDCAMAWWGVAFALGPNINLPLTDETLARRAYAAVQRARVRMGVAPRSGSPRATTNSGPKPGHPTAGCSLSRPRVTSGFSRWRGRGRPSPSSPRLLRKRPLSSHPTVGGWCTYPTNRVDRKSTCAPIPALASACRYRPMAVTTRSRHPTEPSSSTVQRITR